MNKPIEKLRRRIERACIEEGDALYRRRTSLLWALAGMMVWIVVFGYLYSDPSEYGRLLKRASADGWSMLSPIFPLLLFWAVREGLLLLSYLLRRWGHTSNVLPESVMIVTAVAVSMTAGIYMIFFTQRPVPETTVPWVVGTFFILPLAAVLMALLYEPLRALSQWQDLADVPFFRALFMASRRELHPLVRVDGQALTLLRRRDYRAAPQSFITPLSTLRRVTLRRVTIGTYAFATLEFTDGRKNATIALSSYSRQVRERVIDFLRRKLPSSVEFTVIVRSSLQGD